ncbi:hypothetical protein SpCBS45565_g01535 [Spizellomyces sp. 'palustris']|nr:hypothetical protein SpCBS45565_g01535 [Spizellomyces sp. 'palustris']
MPVSTGPGPAHHASASLPGRVDHPDAAMTGPSVGPRPAALPSDSTTKAAVTITAPTAVREKGIDAAVPHPSALVKPSKKDIPSDPFSESVYKLIAVEEPVPPKAERYKSRFSGMAHEEFKKGKKSAASMGPLKVPVPDPKEFLKKGERETGAGFAPPQHPDRTVRKAALPKEPGRLPSTSTKDFVRTNALDNINSVAKKPPSPPASYLTKKTYGQVPPYLRQEDPVPHPSQSLHAQSHSKSDTRTRNQTILQQLAHERQQRAEQEAGLVRLSETERLEILNGLHKNWQKLNSDYQKLSLTVDTVPKIAR